MAKGKKSSAGRTRSRPKKSAAKASSRRARRPAGAATKVKKARPARAAAKPKKAKPAARKSLTPRKKRKTRLSKAQLAEFREMLLTKRQQLLGDLSGMEEVAAGQKGSGNLSSMPTHMADVGTDNFEHEFTLGLLESEQALLREIDAALGRIEDHSYGICLGTGEPIPKARLKAKPWAKYTVEYTRMLEQGLVRPQEEDSGPEDVEDFDENSDDEDQE